MALAYVADNTAQQVRGLVAIGLAAGDGGEEDRVLQTITRLQRPMLDLYGDREDPPLLASAQARRNTAKRSQIEVYRQDRVAGADHHFKGLQQTLVQRVASWLRRVAEETGAQAP